MHIGKLNERKKKINFTSWKFNKKKHRTSKESEQFKYIPWRRKKKLF